MLSFHLSINVIIIVVSFKILDLCPIALFQQLWNTLQMCESAQKVTNEKLVKEINANKYIRKMFNFLGRDWLEFASYWPEVTRECLWFDFCSTRPSHDLSLPWKNFRWLWFQGLCDSSRVKYDSFTSLHGLFSQNVLECGAFSYVVAIMPSCDCGVSSIFAKHKSNFCIIRYLL